MQKIKTLFVFNLFLIQLIFSQKEKSPNYFGINPSITVEPFYQKGELDINILPVVYQKPLNLRCDFRINPILNLGIRTGHDKISHFGFEAALPLFFKKKEEKTECSNGFYAAPVFSLTRNNLEIHNNLGLWLEPGYHLLFKNQVALSFGLQAGTTYFMYKVGNNEWKNHFGFKFVFGKWF